ncbi:ATP11 protein-domain-containing protein [Biscogniauxia sp. FL1348]|nr:ATP11 protein-domain-containing protein [Biscogniauxia sp. FL1348]
MATARFPALRQLLGCSSRHHNNLRGFLLPAIRNQRRWAQVHDVRFLATTQASRSVIEKYREKLDRKAREEGHGDIDGLKAAYADRIQEVKRNDSVSVPGLDALLADAEPAPQQLPHTAAPSPDGLSQKPPPPPPSPTTQGSPGASKPAVKPLSAILDLPKARALPVKELSAVWRLRHAADANSLCAVIPASGTYAALEATARRHPTFVLPVPRGADVGAEIHFLQWVFDPETDTATVLFTQLAEYKARGEWALPHTSVTHYWDRWRGQQPQQQGGGGEQGQVRRDGISELENQDVVLMAGSVVEGRGASVQDARWLVMLMQRFYGVEGRKGADGGSGKRALLEQFSRGDSSFSVEKLLEESERLA